MDKAQEIIDTAGIIDSNSYDMSDVKATQAAAKLEEITKPKTYTIKQNIPDGQGGTKEMDVEVRDITLRVPTSVTDQTVQAAWQLGMAAVHNVPSGIMTVIFPHFRKTEDGKMEPMIGRKDVILAKPEDIARMLRLGETITEINMATAQIAAQKPGDLIAATKTGTIMKDNLTSDLVAKTKGEAGGIIISQ